MLQKILILIVFILSCSLSQAQVTDSIVRYCICESASPKHQRYAFLMLEEYINKIQDRYMPLKTRLIWCEKAISLFQTSDVLYEENGNVIKGPCVNIIYPEGTVKTREVRNFFNALANRRYSHVKLKEILIGSIDDNKICKKNEQLYSYIVDYDKIYVLENSAYKEVPSRHIVITKVFDENSFSYVTPIELDKEPTEIDTNVKYPFLEITVELTSK